MIARGFRYGLAPLPEQEALLRQFAGVCRLVYNLALEQRSTWGRRHRIGYGAQAADLTRLRADFDWVRAVYISCQQQALYDLDRAFRTFFAGQAKYPRPCRRGEDDTFRVPGREIETRRLGGKRSAVRLPKIGWVRFRDTRPMRGAWKKATVSLERLEQLKRQAQRVVARRKCSSKRRARAQRRVSRLQARQARIRRDAHHRAGLDIGRRHATAVLEELNNLVMTATARGTLAEPGCNVRQKAGLNRAILGAGRHRFATSQT